MGIPYETRPSLVPIKVQVRPTMDMKPKFRYTTANSKSLNSELVTAFLERVFGSDIREQHLTPT